MTLHTTAMRLSLPLQMKAEARGVGEIEGLASPFGGLPDAYGDVIAPGAFTRSLREHRSAGTRPAALWAHDQARPIGIWTELEERPDGLHVVGKLNMATESGRDAFEHVRGGSVTGLSIGYKVALGGAQEREDGGRTLTDLDLLEISLVAMPAAPGARVTELKSLGDLQDLLRAVGLPRRASEKLARGGWPALTGGDEDEDETELAALLRDAAAKLRV